MLIFLTLLQFAGPALVDVAETMRELSDIKDSLDIEVKQNFIDPLQNLHDKDLKEIQVKQNKIKTSVLNPIGT